MTGPGTSIDVSEVLRVVTLRAGYNTTIVVLGAALLGAAGGLVGAFALLRKRSLTADALAHATLPGVVLAFLLASSLGASPRSLPVLLVGAAATGVLGVACIGMMLRHTRLREDAAIAVVLSVFFGFGVVLMSLLQRSGNPDAGGVNRFVFGQTAGMRASDVGVMAGVLGVALVATALAHKELAGVSFDDGYARSIGLPVGVLDAVLLTLIVVVTVAGLQAVGIILVVAMLIIPPASARFWTDRLGVYLALSTLLGALGGFAGASVSALLPRAPAGAVIVLCCGGVFVVSMVCAPGRGLGAGVLRRVSLRLRIALDHAVEALYEGRGAAALSASQRTLLRVRGYARGGGAGLALTDVGRRRGARVHRNHSLWEQYLISFADVAPSHVDWSVDQVEHVLSPAQIDRLESLLRARGVEVADGDPA